MKSVVEELLENYHLTSKNEYVNAIQEIIQEITLLGLWRAKFFEYAAFYGGTALRILYGLGRFSEDLDFSLLAPNANFQLLPFIQAIEEELEISGLTVKVDHKIKHPEGSIRSAFIKTGTLETFIRIGLNESLQKYTQQGEQIKIKLEVDIDPPLGFNTEFRYVLKPIPFSIRTYAPYDLFAGKMHALLCRPYKVRVKGRDWYDFIWYVKKEIPLSLSHLEIRMRQSGHYISDQPLTLDVFLSILKEKITQVNLQAAKEDIWRFIKNPHELDGWSTDFFIALCSQIQTI